MIENPWFSLHHSPVWPFRSVSKVIREGLLRRFPLLIGHLSLSNLAYLYSNKAGQEADLLGQCHSVCNYKFLIVPPVIWKSFNTKSNFKHIRRFQRFKNISYINRSTVFANEMILKPCDSGTVSLTAPQDQLLHICVDLRTLTSCIIP